MKEICKQKHLGMLLDVRRALEISTKKLNRTVALLRRFQNILARSALLTIYKCLVRTHLDYGDIIYDQTFNNCFHQKNESLQYNAALAITDAIRGMSTEKIYQELDLEYLQQRRCIENYVSFLRCIKTNVRNTFFI